MQGQAKMTAQFYVDNMNIMMINDEMEDRDIIQDKMLAQPGIIDARIVRSDLLNKEYGDGYPDQVPQDEYDERALQGEEITWISEDENGRKLNITYPIPALKIWRGAKCLGCHEEVKEEGTILGVARIAYSLKAYDDQIFNNVVTSGIMFLCLFALGFVVIALLFNRVLTRRINKLVEVSDQIAKGDLIQEINVDSNDEIGRLMQSMHDMNQQLYQIVVKVRKSAEKVNTASSKIADGSGDLSHRTKEQADYLKDTAASMEEMTAAVMANAENADQANKLATGTEEQAKRGGEVVIKAVESMSEINTATRKISDIISVIDEIAFQTNMLAINAAIEAAQAGKEGRGFAVVADDVRRLAHRCADSAKEIKVLINDTVEKVKDGTSLVDESGSMLGEIVTNVSQVCDFVANIASSSREQSSGIDNINKSVIYMDKVTEQNSVLVGESAKACESLEKQAGELQKAMHFFKIDKQKQQEKHNQIDKPEP